MSHYENIIHLISLKNSMDKEIFLNTLTHAEVLYIRDVVQIGRDKKHHGIECKRMEEYKSEFPNEDKEVMSDAIAHKMQVNEYLEIGMEVLGIKG